MKKQSSYGQLIAYSLWTGSVATVATTLAAAVFGRLENGRSAAPINAISHIAWGDKAARRSDVSLKYTATGLLLNAGAILSWAAVYEFLIGSRAPRHAVGKQLVGGVAVSALAYVTDYHVVPDRLTPGFEKRLSNRSLFGIYAVLAISLGLGSLTRP